MQSIKPHIFILKLLLWILTTNIYADTYVTISNSPSLQVVTVGANTEIHLSLLQASSENSLNVQCVINAPSADTAKKLAITSPSGALQFQNMLRETGHQIGFVLHPHQQFKLFFNNRANSQITLQIRCELLPREMSLEQSYRQTQTIIQKHFYQYMLLNELKDLYAKWQKHFTENNFTETELTEWIAELKAKRERFITFTPSDFKKQIQQEVIKAKDLLKQIHYRLRYRSFDWAQQSSLLNSRGQLFEKPVVITEPGHALCGQTVEEVEVPFTWTIDNLRRVSYEQNFVLKNLIDHVRANPNVTFDDLEAEKLITDAITLEVLSDPMIIPYGQSLSLKSLDDLFKHSAMSHIDAILTMRGVWVKVNYITRHPFVNNVSLTPRACTENRNLKAIIEKLQEYDRMIHVCARNQGL